MAEAYTITGSGQMLRFHRILLDECSDQSCHLPHASRAELFEAMEFDRSRGYDEGVSAAKGER